MKRFNKKAFLALPLSAALVLAACGGENDADNNNNGENNNEENIVDEEGNNDVSDAEDGEIAEQPEMPEMPEPDLEDVPDVVAIVNGVEILKEEFEINYVGVFQQASMESMMSGQEVDQDNLKERVAENLISTEILLQEAENRGFDATEEEIDETLEGLAINNGLESKDDFLAALEEQGMSEDEVMSQIETQVKIDQLVAVESGDTEPTDEEIEEFYDQLVAQQEEMGSEEEIPSFDEIKPEIEEIVKEQNDSEVFQSFFEQLREDADIENLI
ncbi:SurA N-terminal domain-containing protein [Salipaludibacillus sp. HK11]|uniref:SurA N-terminal domain-containing protein n=1 Tax=Salipaludibacillus sp. HK11 TaxID=3394320 RepID=UPI0039FBF236